MSGQMGFFGVTYIATLIQVPVPRPTNISYYVVLEALEDCNCKAEEKW